MTDVESLLRARLHGELDGLEPSTLTAREAVRSGHRARRRRTALVSATAALALVAAGAAGATAVGRSSPKPESVVAAAGLADRTATYAAQFRDGDFAGIRADMTPAVQAQLSEQQLRSVWKQVLDTFGPLVRISPAMLDSGTPATYLLKLQFRSGDTNMRVTYDGDGRVIGITLLTANVEQLDAVPPALGDASRQLVADLAQGRYELVRSRFDARMMRLLSVADLRSGWEDIAVRQHGGFVSTGGMTATKVRGATVVDVFCTMRNGELKVRISYDDSGKVSGLLLQNA